MNGPTSGEGIGWMVTPKAVVNISGGKNSLWPFSALRKPTRNLGRDFSHQHAGLDQLLERNSLL